MAATAVYSAMNGDKALFPLFTKAQAPNETHTTTPIDDITTDTTRGINGLDGAQDEVQKQDKATKARKPRKKQVPGQKTLQEIVNPKGAPNGADDVSETASELAGVRDDESSPRRSKRRRTSKMDSVEVGGQDEASNVSPSAKRHSSPHVIIPASSPLPAKMPPTESDKNQRTPPKKMLRLKAGGKFSSPVSKKPKGEEAPVENVKRRGRPRKSKEEASTRHLTAVVKYDTNTAVGERIDRILAGEERFKKQVKIVPKKQSTPRKDTSKSAHPFFNLDRRKEQPSAPIQPSPRKASAVTPGRLRRETLSGDHAPRVDLAPEVWTSSLLKDRLMFKHPGAKEPAWPDKEQTHVRSLADSELESVAVSWSESDSLPRRKCKATQRWPSESESVLSRFTSQLHVENDGALRPDGFSDPHPSLRLPTKVLISGQEIASMATKQLSAKVTDPGIDELAAPIPSQQQTHPALQSVHAKILKNLSAFDEGKGENMAWSQKYAPSTSAEVLQPIRQVKVLKDWLLSLKVNSVDSTAKLDSKTAFQTEARPKKRKRRRKNDDMDDFLVDSDEELHDMDELTHPEDPPLPSQGRKALNSIVQVAADGVKLSNAVLLSGPHGCGKSAAAYAVAKELGFKVFEISSSERRSGKDVLDRIGDMTENHLVKHHGTDTAEQSSTEEPNVRLDEAFQRDLASGRQGKMANFFKPQVKAKPKQKASSPKKAAKAKTMEAVQNVLKKAPKDQQQSLILLEEVDILFKEDKDFWSTVFKLIATSKRPFIMTCNDEDLVPLQAMTLHAILRFSPPSIDLCADYLLLVAAAEGHLLKREAVSSLYRSKKFDLRAALSELNIWCQMGVGDPRGGLSWIYQRYPPGSDLDVHGRQVRVASDGTYLSGMGSSVERSRKTEHKLAAAWQEHDVDASTALGWEGLDSTAKFENFCRFANELSAADVYTRSLSSSRLDVTQKPMKDKARSHYIEGLPLLQTDEQASYGDLELELLTTATLLSFKTHGITSSNSIDARLESIHSRQNIHNGQFPLTRHAFAVFDPISAPVDYALSTGPSSLQQSAFDGPLDPIATDIAPYVRSIVAFDLVLAEQREILSGGAEGKSAKRARTTRAARSALEGGQRSSTRKERWFPRELGYEAVLETGGKGWPRMMVAETGNLAVVEKVEGEMVPASSAENE